MGEKQSDSKRLAKNTAVLYARMILSIAISLYTSRIILEALGVDDYGVYGVVGGVVGALGFLNASMSGATSRFITIELGRNDSNRLKQTFSSALYVHLGIAAAVLLVSETVGLWFLNHKLVIPEETMPTAQWVFQLSLLSAMIGITQVPYSACIMAHEKMSIYAYFEILNVTLKLLIAYLLIILPGNKLLIYAVLTVTGTIIVRFCNRIYCIRKFPECRGISKPRKDIVRPMLTFSFTDIYGNLCGMSFYQGTSFIINMFFGVAVNAGNSIGNTVAGILTGLSGNVTAAYRPHIVKQYAVGNFPKMESAMRQGIMFVLLLSALVCVPAFILMPEIIQLWLGQIPPYTIQFCRLLIIYCMMGQVNAYFSISVQANGNIKWLSFGGGTLYLLTLPAMWLTFKLGVNPQGAYYVHIVNMGLLIMLGAILVHRLIPELNIRRIFHTIANTAFIILAVSVPCWYLAKLTENTFIKIASVGVINTLLLCGISYMVLLSSDQRAQVCTVLRAKLKI